MNSLRVTLLQANLVWENKSANLDYFAQKLRLLTEPTDLIVLPEMFTTGFTMQPHIFAEPLDGPTLNWMAARAAETGAAITGTFVVVENGLFYNRLVWMLPRGDFHCYDKRHLFSLAGEHLHYSPGTKQLLVSWKGWTIMPLICYDLRFPVWSRNNSSYDLLLYLANWPERRSMAWNALLQARAIENQVYTIGVNRVGVDGNGVNHIGDTSLYDFQGACFYRASYVESMVTLLLDPEKQQDFRKNLPFLADQDTFTIH